MSRTFSFIAVLLVAAAGMYIYMNQMKSMAPKGVPGGAASVQATVDLAAVKRDILQFAKAEQQHLATDGRYFTMDEMINAGDTGLPAGSRGPFQYSIETSSNSFTVIATYSGTEIEGVPRLMRVGPDMNISME